MNKWPNEPISFTVAWAALALHQTSFASLVNKKKIFATNYPNDTNKKKYEFVIFV